MVFLALDQPEARAVRPYVTGALPVYATSMSIDPRADPVVNVDLQGVRYLDMPWFVQPDHPAVMVYPAPKGRCPSSRSASTRSASTPSASRPRAEARGAPAARRRHRAASRSVPATRSCARSRRPRSMAAASSR
jgi:hypothetical protein